MLLHNKGHPWQSETILTEWEKIFAHDVTNGAKSLQSGPTLCDPTDGSPPGSPVPGILQARTLEQVAREYRLCLNVKSDPKGSPAVEQNSS